MDILTNQQFDELARRQDGTRLCLYMPTHRAGRDTQQNPIRLKNLLGQAERELADLGLDGERAARLLAPARRLVDDESGFWQHQSDGLALFLDESGMRYFRVPITFQDLAVAGPRFHVRPLLPLVIDDSRFYILALSENQARLLQGTRETAAPVHAPHIPESFEELAQYIDVSRAEELRSSPYAGAYVRGGGPDEVSEHKRWLAEYCQAIDKGLRRAVNDDRSPLILAATEPLASLYRHASRYPQLLDDHVPGNPDRLSDQQLHEKAWALLSRRFEQAGRQAVERYRNASPRHTLNELERLLPAAYEGRVALALIGDGGHQWGRFDPRGEQVELHERKQPGDEDLLDRLAVLTWRERGAVRPLPPDQMPDGGAAVAVLRG